MESSVQLNCVACFRQFEATEIPCPENVGKVYTVCSNLLKPELFPNDWNGVVSEGNVCPFCKDCYSSGEKLSLLNERLEELQKEIEHFIEYFSAEICRHRTIDNQKPEGSRLKYEVENIVVKVENEDDFFASPVSSPQEELVKEEEESEAEEDEEGVSCQLRNVVIPLQRLELEGNGQIRNLRVRRKVENYSQQDDDSSMNESDDKEKEISKWERVGKRGSSRNCCNLCGRVFVQKQSLSEHMVRRHAKDAEIFHCDFCGFQFKVKKELRRHMKRHSGPFSCLDCPETFGGKERFFGSNQYDFEIHGMTHRQEIPPQCQLCQQIFSNIKNYAHHQKFSCPSSPFPFQCPSCPKTFKAEYLSLLHQLEHQPAQKRTKREQCALCEKVFSPAKDKFKHQKLETHYLTTHTKELLLSCDICGIPLKNFVELNSHRLSHKGKCEDGIVEQKLDCPHCELKFNRKESLREHIKKKHDSSAETFSCEVCLKEFKVRKEFNQHVKQHSTVLPCPLCPKKFSRVGNLNLHLKLHSGDYTCHHCQRKFPSQHSLQLHVDTVHLNHKRFLCHLCGKGFSTRYKQQTHLKTHSVAKSTFRCDVCGESFIREFSFKEHMRLHTGNPPDSSEFPFICDVCGKLFRTESSVKQHQKSAHSEEDAEDDDGKKKTEQVSCEDCGKTFTRKDGLQEHRKRKHDLTAETFVCPVENCTATFKIRKELHVHVKRHSSCIPCGMCQKTFRCAAQLKVHRRLHTGEMFQCPHCEKRFISAGRLHTHVSSVHLKEKNFFCELCGKGFFKKDSYQAHLSTHSDAKVFECKMCGEKFNTEHKRKDHRRKMHTGEIFDCHICSKTFLRKATLKLHIKKHIAKINEETSNHNITLLA